MPQDIKETIQFKHIDHEQVDEKQQAALRAKFKENLAKQNAESKERSTMHETSANRAENILEHQTEFDVATGVQRQRTRAVENTASRRNAKRMERTCTSSVASKGSTRRVRTRRQTPRS